MQWVPSKENITDGLTKHSTVSQRLLYKICANGTLTIPTHEILELVSEEWN